MPLITAKDYISQAFRKIGQLRPAALANDDLYADGLTEWGSLFDSWAAERTMGFSIPQLEFNVAAPGSQQGGNGYLIGPVYSTTGTLTIGSKIITGIVDPGQFMMGEAISGQGIPALSTVASNDPAAGTVTISTNATANGLQTITATPDMVTPIRPDSIVRMNCVMLNQGPNRVYIQMVPISAEGWANLSIRQIPGINVTSLFYYDPQWPNGVINVFPPLIGNGIEVFTWQHLGVPAALTSRYNAPPGYQDAVVWSLAERLWPMCTSQMAVNRVSHAFICGNAYEACQKVRLVNRPIPTMVNDFRGGGKKPGAYYDSFVSQTGLPT